MNATTEATNALAEITAAVEKHIDFDATTMTAGKLIVAIDTMMAAGTLPQPQHHWQLMAFATRTIGDVLDSMDFRRISGSLENNDVVRTWYKFLSDVWLAGDLLNNF